MTKDDAIKEAWALFDKHNGEYHVLVWYRKVDDDYLIDYEGWHHYGDSYFPVYNTRVDSRPPNC